MRSFRGLSDILISKTQTERRVKPMSIILYSNKACPKCAVLRKKMEAKNIDYTENTSIEEMVGLGIKNIPVLCIDGTHLKFNEAVNWINSYKGE